MLSVHHSNSKFANRRRTPSVVSWAVGFEKVLEDPVGLRIFTEFLKREFSSENIKFWVLCEQYRTQTDKRQRKEMAMEIVQTHLCAGATEPVNIDSQSRQQAIEGLETVQLDLFLPAQKQIFNLMKFDCYQRFLKSDLFTESLTAEKLGKPLPCQEFPDGKSPKKCRSRSKSRDKNRIVRTIEEIALLDTKTSNLSSPDENNQNEDLEEKKRKSLLPWQKGRGKNADQERSSSRSPVLRERNINFRRSKRKTGDKLRSEDQPDNGTLPTGFDLHNGIQNQSNRSSAGEKSTIPFGFCRVTLPDSSTALLPTTSEDCLAEAICKLLSKHGIPPMVIEAHLKDTFQMLDLDTSLSRLGGQEVVVELRTLFRVQLPSKKIIAVKSRPEKTCLETLQPVFDKYGYNLWRVELHLATTQIPVNLNGPVSAVNRCQINARLKGCLKEIACDSDKRRNVTSTLFDDIIKGKESFVYDELGILDLESQSAQQVISQRECNGETTSTARNDGPVKRNSFLSSKDSSKTCPVHQNRLSIHEGLPSKLQGNELPKPPEIQRPPKRNTATKNVHYRDSCDFTAVWNRTQKRLDDQRGTELNCELPDFLRPTTKTTGNNH